MLRECHQQRAQQARLAAVRAPGCSTASARSASVAAYPAFGPQEQFHIAHVRVISSKAVDARGCAVGAAGGGFGGNLFSRWRESEATLWRDSRKVISSLPSSKPAKLGRFFTAEQIRSILELALQPWHTIFGIAAMTGLMPGTLD